MDERYETFESVEERLRAIVDEVSREDISLDDALQLYEEAAKLTGVACSLSEQGIEALYPPDEPEPEGDGAEAAAPEGAPAPEAPSEAAPAQAAAASGVAEAAGAQGNEAAPAADEGPSAR